MITHLFDPGHLLAQGQILLQDDGSMVVWSPMDTAVSVLFALIHQGVRDREQLMEAACNVPQVNEMVAQRMLLRLCGNDPNWNLWWYDWKKGFSLWPRF